MNQTMELLLNEPMTAAQLAHFLCCSKPTAYKRLADLWLNDICVVSSRLKRVSSHGPLSLVYWVAL